MRPQGRGAHPHPAGAPRGPPRAPPGLAPLSARPCAQALGGAGEVDHGPLHPRPLTRSLPSCHPGGGQRWRGQPPAAKPVCAPGGLRGATEGTPAASPKAAVLAHNPTEAGGCWVARGGLPACGAPRAPPALSSLSSAGMGLVRAPVPRPPVPARASPARGQMPKAGSSHSRHRPSDVYYIHHGQRVQDRGNKKRGGYSFFSSVFKKYII